MLYFRNDYSEGACPKVLQALIDTNTEQTVGYGMDPYCLAAADLCISVDSVLVAGNRNCNAFSWRR